MKRYIKCSSSDEWAWFRSKEGTEAFEQFLQGVSDSVSDTLGVSTNIVWAPYASSGAMEYFDIELQRGSKLMINGIAIDTASNYCIKYNGVKLIEMLHSGDIDTAVELIATKAIKYLVNENS